MADFTTAQRTTIQTSFDNSKDWIEKLLKANDTSDSDIRGAVAQELSDLADKIGTSGFLERNDFTQTEQNDIATHALQIDQTIESIKDSNDITLMELGGDLAELVTKLGNRDYLRLLTLNWISLVRSNPLPKTPPEEVQDEFNVNLFNLVKGRLNRIAISSKPIASLGCLTPDDYNSEVSFPVICLAQSKLAADLAASSYLELQALKAEEAAAREGSKVSVLGEIWAFVGWDSPLDFLTDIGLTLLTGGGSKILRWGERLVKTSKRLSHAARTAERVLRLEQRAQRMQVRIQEIKRAAEALKKARQIVDIPKKLLAALRMIEKAENQLKMLAEMKKRVAPDYIRSVASTLTSRRIGPGEVNAGSAVTYELARQSILSAVNSTVLGKAIEELREDFSFTALIAGSHEEKHLAELFLLFALLVLREMIVRMAIQIARKRTIDVELFVVEFEGACFNAAESILLDVPLLSKVKASEIARTVVSTIRKSLAGMAQRAFREWYESK